MNTKNKVMIAIIGVMAALIVVMFGFLFYINSDSAKSRQQLELAQRYLLAEEYEQAIAAFEVVLEMDSENGNAYLGLAEAYVETGDLEKAVKILKKASKRVESEKIVTQLEEYISVLEQRMQAEAEETSDLQPQERTETPASEQYAVGFVTRNGELFYYDASGALVTGWFDTDGNRYCARMDGRLYKDGEYEIDNAKYSFTTEGVCLGEVTAQEAWKLAYIDLVNQYEAGQYGFENENFDREEYPIEELGYSLIHFDNKDVPELVIEISAVGWGYTTWLYTYDNDRIYKMVELYSGWHDHYEYIDGEGIVVNVAVDGAGAIYYYSYYQINSNNELVPLYDEALHAEGDQNDIRYYYGDTQITEKEYNNYFEQRIYRNFEGSSSAGEIINEINAM